MSNQIANNAFFLDDASEKPLVTLALFAYNQEKYIREAIAGAFSQTYSPLEIILSDDCSSDKTYEIMQQMAADYKGPHRLILNRNSVNLRTALHVSMVVSQSSGRLIAVAAGDDISLPDRVQETVSAWLSHERPICAIHSARYIFTDLDEPDQIVSISPRTCKSTMGLKDWFTKPSLPAAAPTCTYSREIFDWFPSLIGGSVIEDAPLMFRVCLTGVFIYIDKPLIRQRLLKQSSGLGFSVNNPDHWNRHVLSKTIATQTCVRDLNYARNIDPKLKIRIESLFLKRAAPISKFYISHEFQKSKYLKIAFFLKLLITPVISNNLISRAHFGLKFLGFDSRQPYLLAKKMYKMIIRQ